MFALNRHNPAMGFVQNVIATIQRIFTLQLFLNMFIVYKCHKNQHQSEAHYNFTDQTFYSPLDLSQGANP